MEILLAIDDSPCSEAAIQAVLAQFRPAQTNVRIVHAMDWPNELTVAESFVQGSKAAQEVEAMHEKRRAEAEALAASAAARLAAAGFGAEPVVYDGNARESILEDAARSHPDVIVVGSHGRKGISRVLLGSVAEYVVHQAPCSVEVVRAPACA